jgi:hypothetical protein
MSITNLYSKRNKGLPDIFTYDDVSERIKIQIQYIWDDFFIQLDDDINKGIWREIHKILLKEHAKRNLPNRGIYQESEYQQVKNYLDKNTDKEECLDIIELVFKFINLVPSVIKKHHYRPELNYTPEQAMKHLNTRFLENGIGYEFRGGEVIRIDNKLLHHEIIIPTLHFLSDPKFKNSNDEYLSAHEHFRHSRTKECLNDCLKALESTLKIVCDLNGWAYNQKDNASTLIKAVIDNNLIPDFLLQHFSSLRSSLESGVPTVRNRLGGHGQGIQTIEVPMHYASYMLYLTGTTINFLVSCQQELKSNTF